MISCPGGSVAGVGERNRVGVISAVSVGSLVEVDVGVSTGVDGDVLQPVIRITSNKRNIL
jgi:hypothetical protein